MHFIKAKSILSSKNTMNLYRGCTHDCIYCDSRSNCYGMNHSFDDIAVKENSIKLLEEKLSKKRKRCMIHLGSMSDPYIPLEKELEYTRRTLELIYQYGFGLSLITKSDLILRDLDIIKKINEKTKCVIQMTLTTFDDDLCRKIERNVCVTSKRVEVLKKLHEVAVPTVVWLSPILPFINDTEENIKGILDYCIEAKVCALICFGMGLTLRDGNREYFYKSLDASFPRLKEKYINSYGKNYFATSSKQNSLMKLFHKLCDENNIVHNNQDIFQYLASFDEKKLDGQMSIFDFMDK